MTDAPQPLDIVDVEPLDIVDVGGGTGGFAVPMAEQGHRVTVVDPSPDALAALERRARDAGVEVRAVQGDAVGLLDVIRKNSADLVLCHGLLEQLDDVESGLAALVQAMRPGGALSVLAANRNAVVLARAVAGRFGEARHALDDFAGRWGAGDPLLRRFTELQLVELLTGSGLTVGEVHGVRTFADLVSGGLIDSEPEAHEALLELEAATADLPEFRAIAAQLHVLAYRP
jgi:SAM-dependent methyltransferase